MRLVRLVLAERVVAVLVRLAEMALSSVVLVLPPLVSLAVVPCYVVEVDNVDLSKKTK